MISRRRLPPLADRGPLRVLFTTTSLSVGGAERVVANLMRNLNRERFEAELCCFREPGELGRELAEEFPVHSFLYHHRWDVSIWGRLTRLLTRRRIDALVTLGPGERMFWGRLAAWRAGLPVILSAIYSPRLGEISPLNRRLAAITDGFVGVTKSHAQRLVGEAQLPAEKVFVIPGGVDVERFRPRPISRAKVRHHLSLPETAPVCGMVVPLREEFDFDAVLQIARLTRDRIRNAHFVIVGGGLNQGEFQRQVDQAGLATAVRLLGPRRDVAEILASLDLFLHTRCEVANPLALLEAMACGLPVVAARTGCLPESVEHGLNGWLVDPHAPQEFSERCVELLGDAQLRGEMGAASRELAAEHWSLERTVLGYQDLITSIYNRKSGTGDAEINIGPRPSRKVRSLAANGVA